MRAFVLVFLVACGGTTAAEIVPSPVCVTESARVDCTANDCHVLEPVDGAELGTTVRGRCPTGDRCIVWIDTKATYGVCNGEPATTKSESDAAPDSAADVAIALPKCPKPSDACVYKDAVRLCHVDGGPHLGCDPDSGTWVTLETSPCLQFCE